MRVNVSWETTYRYSEPVRLIHTELRVLPSKRFGQQVEYLDLVVEPEVKVAVRRDAFGNDVHHFDLLGSVDALRVSMEARVETGGGVIEQAELAPLEQHLLTHPTPRCPFDPRIQAFAAAAGPAPDPVAFAAALMEHGSRELIFETGRTDVEDTALDLLRLRRGVCQDFAHLMIAAVRMRGAPARYVSGYLASDEMLLESSASHAWMQVWHEGAWHGFDAANGVPEDERYVITAVGRDYDDVPPLRGSFRGQAIEEWNATVRVEAQSQQQQQQQ